MATKAKTSLINVERQVRYRLSSRSIVQAFEGVVGQDVDPAPDRRIDIKQGDRDSDDLILHAATMTRVRFAIHSSKAVPPIAAATA